MTHTVSPILTGATTGRSGLPRESGGASLSSAQNKRDMMRLLARRLDSVCIEDLPWQECVDRYDSAETFFFFDPPYVTGRAPSYQSRGAGQMEELRKRTDTLAGRWILTTCDSKESRDIFKGLGLRGLVRARGISNRQGNAGTYAELIVTPK